MDASGAWVHFTIYNMAPDSIKMEDTVIIPEPFLQQVKINMLPLAGTKGTWLWWSFFRRFFALVWAF